MLLTWQQAVWESGKFVFRVLGSGHQLPGCGGLLLETLALPAHCCSGIRSPMLQEPEGIDQICRVIAVYGVLPLPLLQGHHRGAGGRP